MLYKCAYYYYNMKKNAFHIALSCNWNKEILLTIVIMGTLNLCVLLEAVMTSMFVLLTEISGTLHRRG